VPWVVPCIAHSAAGTDVTVWAFVSQPFPGGGCPCERGSRFIVARTEQASEGWLHSADVVVGCALPSLRAARRTARGWLNTLPGCQLVAVPSLHDGAVLSTDLEQVVLAFTEEELLLAAAHTYARMLSGHHLSDVSVSVDLAERGALGLPQ
jgi:hypothetical protein